MHAWYPIYEYTTRVCWCQCQCPVHSRRPGARAIWYWHRYLRWPQCHIHFLPPEQRPEVSCQAAALAASVHTVVRAGRLVRASDFCHLPRTCISPRSQTQLCCEFTLTPSPSASGHFEVTEWGRVNIERLASERACQCHCLEMNGK